MTTSSAEDAYAQILEHGGAIAWNRDVHDERVIDQLETITGGIILTEGNVGGFATIPVETRPAGYDTDNDGMPNTWEQEHGLNPNLASDRNQDFYGDGYRNLEE